MGRCVLETVLSEVDPAVQDLIGRLKVSVDLRQVAIDLC